MESLGKLAGHSIAFAFNGQVVRTATPMPVKKDAMMIDGSDSAKGAEELLKYAGDRLTNLHVTRRTLLAIVRQV